MAPLDWIHALCNQIPDPGQHLVRYYGAYANKLRSRRRRREEPSPTTTPPGTVLDDRVDDDGRPAPSPRRQSWRRLIKKLFEVDPVLCPKCLVEMKIVAVITQVPVIDKILNHIRKGGGHDPFDVRAPPPD